MEETGAPEGYEYSENIQFMLEDDKAESTIVKVYDAVKKTYQTSDRVEMFEEAEDDDEDDSAINSLFSSIGRAAVDLFGDSLRLTRTGSLQRAPKTGDEQGMLLVLAFLTGMTGICLFAAQKRHR